MSKIIAISAGLAALIVAGASSASDQAKGSTGYWAVVDSDGTLVRGKNVGSVVHSNTGAYQVNFTKNISKCAYIANIGNADANSTVPAGVAQVVEGGNIGTDSLVVIINNLSGTDVDSPFMVMVMC